MKLQCVSCDWSGYESECDVVESFEPYEFWGSKGVQRIQFNHCPQCGSEDLDEAESDDE